MPQTVTYRLTIRNASTTNDPDGTADELVVTSIAAGTNPYIAGAPSGDGAEVDPLTGAVRTGAYVVEVVDADTGTDATGTIRVVTNKLEDATFRQQLLSRRAYVDVLRDGVSSRLVAGYVSSIRLISPMRYAISVGDTRRVERSQTIFQGAALGAYTTRGCITGGPVTADFGTVKARGGWRYRWTNIGTNLWQATFISGYASTNASVTVRDWRSIVRDRAVQVVANYTRINAFPSTGAANVYDFAFANVDQTGAISDGIVAFIGSSASNAVATNAVLVESSEIAEDNPLFSDRLVFYWPSNPYSAGTDVFISLTTAQVTEDCPLYLDAHPVDLVTAIWTNARVKYSASAAATVKTLIGDTVRLACRFPQAPLMDEFLQQAIYGPFGISERTNINGEQELFPTRIKTDVLPTLTMNAAAMRGADETVFDLDEQTAVSGIRLTQQVLAPAVYTRNPINSGPSDPATTDNIPLDGIVVSEVTQTAQYLDQNLAVFAGRVVEYRIPGMIHTAADFVPNTVGQLDAMAIGTFDRFGRGCQAAEVSVLATAGVAAAQIGDEVYFEAPHFPNKGYRIGESTVGARIMQVVRRTETPAGPVFRLLDSGLAAQPVSPAATITIAQNPNAATNTARFTITNAATINATNILQVRVEWAVGTTTPTGNGADFAFYAAGQVPTGAVDLPPVTTPGQTVYVRARTEQAGRRPSAWTAWASVTLVNIPTISGLSGTNIRQTAVTLTWTNGSSTLPLAIFAFQGGSAPANWAPYRVGTLPAGTTSTVVRNLTGPSIAWTLGVAYETPQAVGAVTALTITTNSTLDTSTRPAGLAIIPGVDDATLTQGIALALWASDQTLDLQIQRSTTSGSGFATIATVSGATTVYVDQLPRNGVTYYYRIAHVLGGFNTSVYTPEISSTARGVPVNVTRPGAVSPVVQVQTSETATTGTITLTITDPQNRVIEVRFRERTNGGAWSAWTVDTTVPYSYTGTLPSSGFLDIEYEVTGFDAAGTAAQVLAGGVESFDTNTTPDMVSVVGTFTNAGAFTLAISADSDTASIKYATSVISQPNLATTQAQAAINGRNITATLGGPFVSGSTVFVSVLGYTGTGGTGLESVLFEYRFTRDGGLVYSECLATMATSTATQIVVTVTATATSGTPTVQLVAVTGSAVKDPLSPNIGVPQPSGTQWTFTRGAALGQPGGAQFRAVLAGTQSDDDFIEIPEQGRDTTYLTTRARIFSTSATQVVVRVAVLDKYSNLSASIAYTTTGITTITPGTPQSVTTAQGDTFPAETPGQYVDYTIDRPTVGLGPGRVVFTASAGTVRVADSDSVDIPAQDVGAIAISCAFNDAGTQATLAFAADTTVGSFKYATSTSAFPTLGTVQATSAINGRNSTQTVSGTFTLGTVLYVSAVTYSGASGTGRESAIFQLAFRRQNTAPTIINRQPANVACYATTDGTIFDRTLGYYTPGPTAGGTNPNRQGIHFAQVIVPRGVTLRAVRVNCYAIATASNGGSGDIITVNFYRVESNGTNSFLGNTQQNIYAGWQTLAVSSLSESTTDRSYYVRIEANWNGYPGNTYTPNSDLRVGWIEAEYDKANTDQNI